MNCGRFYMTRDVNALRQGDAPYQILEAWQLHWRGQLSRSAEVSRQWLTEQADCTHEWYGLVAADLALVEAKIGHERSPFLKRTHKLCRTAAFVAAYSIFTREWGRDQRRVWPALRAMFAAALLIHNFDALCMSSFLMAHTAAIAGWRRLGCFIARRTFMIAIKRRNLRKEDLSSLYGMVMATIPCSLWLSGSNDVVFNNFINSAVQGLPDDPYYRAIFHHCCLYRAAYTGKILDAEIYAQRLIAEIANGNLQRYVVPAQLLSMVPVAIRGYGHLLGDRVEQLLSHLKAGDDGAAKAASYRAAAIILLCRNQRLQSREYVQLAHDYDSNSGFHMVWKDIDARIKRYAGSDKLFNPTQDIIGSGLVDYHFAPNSGQLLSRIVQATEQNFEQEEMNYGNHIAAALSEHFSVEAICTGKVVNDNDIFIQFPHFSIVLHRVDPERRASLHTQISSISPLLKSLAHMRTYRVAAENSSKDRAVAATAYQVAHDIRSPLAALNVVAQNIGCVPEDVRTLLKSSVDRIKEIADVLIEQSRTRSATEGKQSGSNPLLSMPVTTLIDEIIAERKAACESGNGRAIKHVATADDVVLFVDCCISDLRRSLANLLTNALEAVGPSGQVTVNARREANDVLIEIEDDGCGIPEEIQPKLFVRNSTFGKAEGNGLGLHFAKTTAERLGGSIQLQSQMGKGTKIAMKFPMAAEPRWFLRHIRVHCGTCVVIIDDDQPIHQLWNVRLKSLREQADLTIEHFSDVENFRKWWSALSSERRLSSFVMCDHEMQADRPSGIELIRELQLHRQSALITSHYGSAEVQQACISHDIRMLPKGMASSVPLLFAPPRQGMERKLTLAR